MKKKPSNTAGSLPLKKNKKNKSPWRKFIIHDAFKDQRYQNYYTKDKRPNSTGLGLLPMNSHKRRKDCREEIGYNAPEYKQEN